jgi:hypothetical protein
LQRVASCTSPRNRHQPHRAVATETQLALAADRLEQLRSQSQALEELLAELPRQLPSSAQATALPIDAVEAQVQWLDHQILLAGADLQDPTRPSNSGASVSRHEFPWCGCATAMRSASRCNEREES